MPICFLTLQFDQSVYSMTIKEEKKHFDYNTRRPLILVRYGLQKIERYSRTACVCIWCVQIKPNPKKLVIHWFSYMIIASRIIEYY